VLIQAHQGGGGLAYGNTEKQFRKAAKTNVHMVELDTQITKDGVIVVNHSDRIMDVTGRSCDHDGLRLHTVTYARAADVRCAGEPLARFEEVLDIFHDTDIRLNVEIKAWDNHFTQPDESLRDDARQIIRTLDEHGYAGRYILSFFDWRVLLPTVRELHPDLYVIALERSSKMKQPTTRMFQAVRDAAALGADAFEPDLPFTQENLLQYIVARGMDPQVWYTNTPEDVRFALANGINPISSDDPTMAADVIADAARGRLTPAPVLHKLRGRAVLTTTLRAERPVAASMFGWGRVPLSGQAKLSDVQLEVTTTAKSTGSLRLEPKGAGGMGAVSVDFPAGTARLTVLVPPGDLGHVTFTSTEQTSVRVRLIGYHTAAYIVST